MRKIDQAGEYARLDALKQTADAVQLAAMQRARAEGISEKVLMKHPAVAATEAPRVAALRALVAYCIANELDLFGDPRRSGSGPLGEIPIIQIPQVGRGR